MAPSVESVSGLVFVHSETGDEYGPIRSLKSATGIHPSARLGFQPFAEDECGNAFVFTGKGDVGFWDHETEQLTLLATDWQSFARECRQSEPVKLDPAAVKSAWINPEFAKKLGLKVPEDGKVK